MAFSFYQSLRTVPRDLDEVSRHFGLSPWLRFWRLEVPFAAPGLIWNTMMSMSGGWFFVVASEAITVGDTTVKLPGIGSWLAVAIDAKDFRAVLLAVGTMAMVILALRPAAVPADRRLGRQVPLRTDRSAAAAALLGLRILAPRPRHAAASRRSMAWIGRRLSMMSNPVGRPVRKAAPAIVGRIADLLWLPIVARRRGLRAVAIASSSRPRWAGPT